MTALDYIAFRACYSQSHWVLGEAPDLGGSFGRAVYLKELEADDRGFKEIFAPGYEATRDIEKR
ncbi:hypothetical protein [Salinisphaera hydrothermalis]|uniref:hypothetical protein n=1 Tax=Salinisphaera hydrothermalis TaxID=563188 RepID=UPI0033424B6F